MRVMNKASKMKDVNRKLSTPITILKESEGDELVKDLDDYINGDVIKCEVRYLRGKRLFEARASNLKVEIEFIVRRAAGVQENNRIMFNDSQWIIESILPVDSDNLYKSIRAYRT